MNTVTVKYGMIGGGRAGDEYKAGTLELPTNAEDLEAAIDNGDIENIVPNDGDLYRLIEAIVNGELFCDWDVYGEGVIALSTTATEDEIELAVRREYR